MRLGLLTSVADDVKKRDLQFVERHRVFVRDEFCGHPLLADLNDGKRNESSNMFALLVVYLAPLQVLATQPYSPNWYSLQEHQPVPEWFRDAKFGIEPLQQTPY